MIKIENVTKRFDGYAALDHFSLTVPKGAIYGLMGLNGAGKTTIIKHLSGLLVQDEGTITIDNQEIEGNEALKARMAVIPDELFFFRGYNLIQMSRFHRKIYPLWDEDRFQAMVADSGLPEKGNIGKFSKGMKKQAAFCLALAGKPDYLILDEPVDGLDPIVRRKLWHYIMDDVADREMTVLVSSHNAKEMEDVCNYIGIIAGGRMVFEGDLLELLPGLMPLGRGQVGMGIHLMLEVVHQGSIGNKGEGGGQMAIPELPRIPAKKSLRPGPGQELHGHGVYLTGLHAGP